MKTCVLHPAASSVSSPAQQRVRRGHFNIGVSSLLLVSLRSIILKHGIFHNYRLQKLPTDT